MKRRSYRKNALTTDDMLYIGVAAVLAGGLGFVMGKRAQLPTAPTTTAGLGAYFIDPVNIPISMSGLGNYVRVR